MTSSDPRKGYENDWFSLLVTLVGSCVVLFVLAPIVGLVLSSSLSDLSSAASDREVIESIKLTLFAALCATTAATLFGIPLSYALARREFPGKGLVLAIVDLPIIIPHSAAGIALLAVIGRRSVLGRLFGDGLVGTVAGISLAMAFVSVPFLINAAREAFAAVPTRLESAARTLGATPLRGFFTVSLPLAWRGILSGMIMMWGRGISEFGAVIIIAYHPMTTPVLVYRRFIDFGLSYARSAAVILIAICVAIFAALRILAVYRVREGGRDA
jgi:molybdate/tungstate transport system permease protein